MAEFRAFSFSYSIFKPKINVIISKSKGKTKTYTFDPLMLSENSLSGQILVFKDLNFIPIGIDKIDLQ